MQKRGDASVAGDSLDSLRQKYNDLQTEFQAEIEKLAAALRPEALGLESLPLGPRKRISPWRKSSWHGCRISPAQTGN